MKKQLMFALFIAGLVIFGFILESAQAQTSTTGFKVIRVPAVAEPARSSYEVHYPEATSYTRPAGGYLSLKDASGVEIAAWGPNQWVRVEKIIPPPSVSTPN